MRDSCIQEAFSSSQEGCQVQEACCKPIGDVKQATWYLKRPQPPSYCLPALVLCLPIVQVVDTISDEMPVVLLEGFVLVSRRESSLDTQLSSLEPSDCIALLY